MDKNRKSVDILDEIEILLDEIDESRETIDDSRIIIEDSINSIIASSITVRELFEELQNQ